MKRSISLICALAMVFSCLSGLTSGAFAADISAPAGSLTYYVSTGGKGGNDGLSMDKPLPGLAAVPWDQLLPGDSVLLKKGETFPGAIKLVDVHGTGEAPITIGSYGTAADAPKLEARGQGIWLPETGNDNGATPGKYASAGVLLYGCSYVTVTDLEIVNRPDALKTSFIDVSADRNGVSDHSGIKLPCAGVAVAADGGAAAEGIVLNGITVRGDSDVQTVMTETSSPITQTNVTKGAEAAARTLKNAAGTYYVSSLTGSDSNDGSSPDKAFYSLHKINELNLQPGAKVYLERGSVFEDQYLHPNGGGSADSPIIIDAYGADSAPKPLINTNGEGVWYQNYRKNLDNDGHLRQGYVSSSILIYDVEYIEVKNIAMTNFGRYGETPGADFENLGSYDGGTVPGETGYNGTGQDGEGNKIGCYQWGGKMARTGVAGVSQNVGTMDHVYLQNLDIENVYGNVMYKHMDNGGIYFTIAYALDEGATGIPKIDDLRIEGCYLKRVSRWGIAAAYTGAYSGLFGGSAISDETCQRYGVTNLYIGHNYLEEVGGDPITTMYAYEPLVEYNVSCNGGREMSSVAGRARYINGTVFAGNQGDVSAGIWPWKCKTALFEHNECYTMLYGRVSTDGGVGNNDAQAWDADWGDSTIYQYNYSSGNSGSCVMYCGSQAYNSVFRYNISYKDGMPGNDRGVLDMSGNPNGQIINNTFIIAENTQVHRGGHYGHAQVENNIFFNLGNTYDPQWSANGNLNYNNNIYSGFGSSSASDGNAITAEKSALFADPTFAGAYEAPTTTDKSGLNYTAAGIRNWARNWDTDFDMFKLKDTVNAAVNAGVPHSYDGLTQDSNFGVPRVDNAKDFYGNELDDVHDIGAHDTLTADPAEPDPVPSSENSLVSSLYELRNTTELQVPLGENLSPTVETFLKGLTVSEGATAKVYQTDGATPVTEGNVAADMKVKIVAEDGTVNPTVYTIKSKTLYNSQIDWVDNQQGNVWFYQAEDNGVFTNQTSMGTTYKDWTGSGGAVEQNQAVGDINNSKGAGFTFRAPVSGTVTVSFNYKAADDNAGKASATGVVANSIRKRASTPDSKWQTWLRTYRNGVENTAKAISIPMDSITPINVTSYTITVAQGDTLSFMIRNETKETTNTSNGGNHGVYFNPVITYVDEEFTEPADETVPTAPSGLRAKNVTETTATLSWTASTDNVAVTGYKLQVNDGAEETLAAEETGKTLTGLTPNTQYTVTVKAVDAAGNASEEASVTFRTLKAPDTTLPTVPGNATATDLTPVSAVLSWTAATDDVGVAGYEITVGTRTELVRNATRFTLDGLTPNTAYSVSIKAVDAAGNKSAGTADVSFTTTQDTQAPTVPSGLAVATMTGTSATLRWSPSSDDLAVAGYMLKVGETGHELDLGNVRQHTLTALDRFTGYTVFVRAYDAAGNRSDWSAPLTFTTLGSSDCELISTLFEIRSDVLQLPYTDNNPLTVEELRDGFEVSEDAKVKVYDGTTEVTEGNVTAGMVVKIVAQDGTVNPTAYTVANKNAYNHFTDWVSNQQGNVWFTQYRRNDAFHNWEESRWNSGGWYSDDANGYASAQQLGACDDIRPTAQKSYQGSGFTFRAPANGMVEISFPTQPVFRNDNCGQNTYTTYLVLYKNGVEFKRYSLPKSTTQNANIQPLTVSLAREDTLAFMITNEGSTGTAGNGGTKFTPAVTYLDRVYRPDPTAVTLNKTSATLYTNGDTADRTIQLTAAVLPEDADQTVTWTSTNPAVAYVSQDGLVIAVANGTTAIIASTTTSTGRSVEASCTVTVRTKLEGITVKRDGAAVGSAPIVLYTNEGDANHSVTLTAETVPATASDRALTWTTESDKLAVEADERGAVITATINATDVGEAVVEVTAAADPTIHTALTFHVVRKLEHDVTISGNPKVGQTLTADLNQLDMTIAGKNALTFQWKRNGTAIKGATGGTYVLTVADIGAAISVEVSADPATFYEGTRTATLEDAVTKADGPDAPTGLTAVNCTSGDNGQITGLDTDKVYEYKLSTAGDDAWQTVSQTASIDDLAAGNYQVRLAATDSEEPGAATVVTVIGAGVTAYTITATVYEGGVIQLGASQAAETDTVTVSALPKTGYRLVDGSLKVLNGTVEVPIENGAFTMPAANVTVEATFEKLKVRLTHALENIHCDQEEHDHEVDYGDQPTITLTPVTGYQVPTKVQVTVTDSGEKFTAYSYDWAEDRQSAVITFTGGITADLTVTGVAELCRHTIGHHLTNLTCSLPTNGHFVEHGAALTITLSAAEGYRLPTNVIITMGGVTFTDFTYDSDSGVLAIPADLITTDLIITANGVDISVPVVPVTGVQVNRNASVIVGRTVTLTATVLPADATEKLVVWTTSDPSVATVDENGVVTGVAEGTAIITVTTVDGERTDTCAITVQKEAVPSSSGSGSSSGSSRPNTTTVVKENEDGSKTTTVTKPDGTVTETTKKPDGTVEVVETGKDGTVTETTTDPEGGVIEKVTDPKENVTITVTDPKGEVLAEVTIPAEIPAPETTFVDVPEGHWAEKAINTVAGLGLVNGVGEDRYDMVTPMTRGSLATILYRLSSGKASGYAIEFADVAMDGWYVAGIAWAAKTGVVQGIEGDGVKLFWPNDVITREQLAVMLCRYAKLLGMDTKAEAKALNTFSDGDNTGTWAVDGVAWCVESGILRGKDGARLDPTAEVTRAEAAVMLQRFIGLVK